MIEREGRDKWNDGERGGGISGGVGNDGLSGMIEREGEGSSGMMERGGRDKWRSGE